MRYKEIETVHGSEASIVTVKRKAWVFGRWAVTHSTSCNHDRDTNGWCCFAVTHVKSGRCIDYMAATLTYSDAIAIASHLDAHAPDIYTGNVDADDAEIICALVGEALGEAIA